MSGNIIIRYQEEAEISLSAIDLSTSFLLHNSSFKDAYLKYMLFRTLYRKCYTNDKPFKMGIRKSDICVFCKSSTVNSDQMLLYCSVIGTI